MAKNSSDSLDKNYKTWAVIATTISVILAIIIFAIVTLTPAKTECSNDSQDETTANNSAVVLGKPNSNSDISKLDAFRLVNQSDLSAGEIPDHYVGNKDSSVVVIEYEDFACSYCQALYEYVEQIHADYQDRVLFIHRGFSLNFPNSNLTLSAAEAAYLVGGEKAYWAMTGLIHLHPNARWTGEEVFGGQKILNNYAKEIGLDVGEFREAMASVAVANKLARDRRLGEVAGVAGTPTWFINGEQVTARDSDIRAALDAILQ